MPRKRRRQLGTTGLNAGLYLRRQRSCGQADRHDADRCRV